jgi:hypothetical protein
MVLHLREVGSWHFERTSCLHLQGSVGNRRMKKWPLKIWLVHSFETSISHCPVLKHHILEEQNPQLLFRKNLRTHKHGTVSSYVILCAVWSGFCNNILHQQPHILNQKEKLSKKACPLTWVICVACFIIWQPAWSRPWTLLIIYTYHVFCLTTKRNTTERSKIC